MTTPEQLRAIVEHLQTLVHPGSPGGRDIVFDVPSVDDVAAAGLDRQTYQRLRASPWWDEMVEDVVTTPEFAGPDEAADVVLTYARDVVEEYVRKRFELDG